MSNSYETPSQIASIDTVTVEQRATGLDAIIRHQFATILQLQAETAALRAVISKRAMDDFLATRCPVAVTFTMNGVTHHVFVYADDDDLIHTVEV